MKIELGGLYNKLLKIRLIRKLLAWHGLYSFITKKPNIRNIYSLYFLSDYNLAWKNRLANEIMSNKECFEFVKKRKRVSFISDLNRLSILPENSLGHLYAKHISRNQIKPILPIDCKIDTDFKFIMYQLISTHDIYHVILESDTSYADEGHVAGFTIAQTPAYTQPSYHIAAGILKNTTVELADMNYSYMKMISGWILGRQASQLFPVNWDEFVDTDIDEVRKHFNINLKVPLLEILCEKK